MSKGTCSRCGAEESMFWYPYGFGVAPIPSIVDRNIDRTQYFTLCDECQQKFVDFMHNKSWPYFDSEKLKKMMDNTVPIIMHDVDLEKVNEGKLEFSDRKKMKK